MRTRTLIRRAAGTLALPGFCLLAMAYFGHHALFDDHGLRRLFTLRSEVAQKQHMLEEERAKRLAFEGKVEGLSAKRIDPDLLDERAREILGLARPDEIIIFKSK